MYVTLITINGVAFVCTNSIVCLNVSNPEPKIAFYVKVHLDRLRDLSATNRCGGVSLE